MPVVAVFNAAGTLQQAFFAGDQGFNGGLWVAAGDVNGDGTADAAVGAGLGGVPVIRVFDGKTQQSLVDFFAFEGSIDTGNNNGGGNSMQANAGDPAEMNLYYGIDPALEAFTDWNAGLGELFSPV